MTDASAETRAALNFAFWRRFLEKQGKRNPLLASLTPVSGNYRDVHIGLDSVKYVLHIGDHHIRVALFIESPDVDSNDALMRRLRSRQADIENSFGAQLTWDESGKKARTISSRVEAGGLLDAERWDDLSAQAAATLDKLHKALLEPLRSAGLLPQV